MCGLGGQLQRFGGEGVCSFSNRCTREASVGLTDRLISFIAGACRGAGGGAREKNGGGWWRGEEERW